MTRRSFLASLTGAVGVAVVAPTLAQAVTPPQAAVPFVQVGYIYCEPHTMKAYLVTQTTHLLREFTVYSYAERTYRSMRAEELRPLVFVRDVFEDYFAARPTQMHTVPYARNITLSKDDQSYQ